MEEDLEEKEEALRRMNAEIDGELIGVVSDVESMLQRQLLSSAPAPRDVVVAEEDENACDDFDGLPLSSSEKIPPPRPAVDRMKKAQAKVLRERVSSLEESERDANRRKAEAEEAHSKAEAEAKSLKKEVASLRGQLEKEKKARGDLALELAEVKRDLVDANRSEQARRRSKSDASRSGTSDPRLQRALEDAEKQKAIVAKVKVDLRDAQDDARKEKERLEAQAKKLERQKAELLAAFRKQLKLIDVLKRQKLHMEAARLLAFTEDEFMKVVDWGTTNDTARGEEKRTQHKRGA